MKSNRWVIEENQYLNPNQVNGGISAGGPPLTCLKSVGAPSFAYFAEGGLRQPSTNGSRCKLVSGYTGT